MLSAHGAVPLSDVVDNAGRSYQDGISSSFYPFIFLSAVLPFGGDRVGDEMWTER